MFVPAVKEKLTGDTVRGWKSTVMIAVVTLLVWVIRMLMKVCNSNEMDSVAIANFQLRNSEVAGNKAPQEELQSNWAPGGW